MPIQRLKRHSSSFTTFCNKIFYSIESPEAKLIWVYLLTKPDDWIINEKSIKNELDIGRGRYQKGMRELKKLNLLGDIYIQNTSGKFIGHNIILYEEPHIQETSHTETRQRGETADILKTKEELNTKRNKPPLDPPKGKSRSKPDFSSIQGLNQKAWAEWTEFKKTILKQSYKTTRAAVELAKYSPDIQQQAVDHSITNEYKGLFPEKFKTNGTKNNGASATISSEDIVKREILAYLKDPMSYSGGSIEKAKQFEREMNEYNPLVVIELNGKLLNEVQINGMHRPI